MKKKFIILGAAFLILTTGYAQVNDSVRTRNDKPATPQSLRTPNMAPRTHVHTINKSVPPQQTINHGATESNDPSNLNKSKTIAPNSTNGQKVPVTPVTIKPGIALKDTSITNKGVMQNGQSNASNPIRK
ncbi:MAG: hypothetical protein ABIN25_14380 [Ginsengibacter sp.]